uniref:Integrase catalytic domain-containing protein n=1 Tax=Mastacembelus armatus TaxID=205130 RepID=A0A7N8YPR4_9TELE
MYLVVVDYFSRYVEIAQLSNTKSTDVIVHLKSIFARHGIPEVLMSDNGPQFSGQDFTHFASTYGFNHITSSPKFPQSNGEAERAVQTVKGLLKKASDPYLALLAYRATPLQSGFSPAQLLMGRRLRTTVPTLPSQLDPALPDMHVFARKEKEKRIMDTEYYNRRHRARPLSDLVPGEHVWITDAKESGTVLQNHTSPRSYLVDVPNGVVRRNRQHLIPLHTHTSEGAALEQQERPKTITEQVSVSPEKIASKASGVTATPRTRSGRAIVKPDRLNL